MRLRRSAALPENVRAALGARSPLAWATDAGGTTAVVTAADLTLVAPAGTVRTVPWELLEGASWDDETSVLTIREVDGTPHPLDLPDAPRRFIQAVRQHIESSVVHVVQRPIGAGAVRAAIRRDAAGNLTSQVSVVGTTRRDAEVQRLADEVEAQARGDVGLPS